MNPLLLTKSAQIGKVVSVEENPWLPVADAARYLGFSPATLKKWADLGDVKCIKTRSGHRRFLKSDLDEFIREHSNVPEGGKAEDKRLGASGSS